MTPERYKELQNIITEFLAKTGEHFDTVLVLAEINEEGMSTSFHGDSGSWYAQQGMAHEFINRDQAKDNVIALANELEALDGGDEETWKQE